MLCVGVVQEERVKEVRVQREPEGKEGQGVLEVNEMAK